MVVFWVDVNKFPKDNVEIRPRERVNERCLSRRLFQSK